MSRTDGPGGPARAGRAGRVRCGLAALAAGAVVAAGCGVPTSRQARAVPADAVPEALRETATTVAGGSPASDPVSPVTPPTSSEPVQLFFVRGDQVVPVTRRLPLPLEATAVLAALFAGPDRQAQAEGVRSALADEPPRVQRVVGDTAVVPLPAGLAETTGREQRLALAQLVFTLTGLAGIGSVTFEVDGRPVPVPRADGTLADDDEPVGRPDYQELVGPA